MIGSSATIAALLTPLAPGAIAVIGLAGPRTDAILSRILRRAGGHGPVLLPDRRPVFCRLVDGGETVDDVIVVRVASVPRAVVEINTHGGVRIAQRALSLLAGQEATIVDGLAFHESVSARGTVERDVDRALLSAASRRQTGWLLAQRMILPDYLARLDSLSAEENAAFRRRSLIGIRLLAGIRIAIIGPVNAGKSTLANRLIGADRVITSEEPGTTRDWVSETALIRGWPVTLIDTAGIRQTGCPIETEAIRRGGEQADNADLVIVLLDGSTTADELQKNLKESVASIPADLPRLTALNKCDLPALRGDGNAAGLPGPPPIRISALTGQGLDDLEARIESLLGLGELDESLPTGFLPEHLENSRPAPR